MNRPKVGRYAALVKSDYVLENLEYLVLLQHGVTMYPVNLENRDTRQSAGKTKNHLSF